MNGKNIFTLLTIADFIALFAPGPIGDATGGLKADLIGALLGGQKPWKGDIVHS